jgi:hypothetical protein
MTMWQVQVMWLHCSTAWHLFVIKRCSRLSEWAS